MNIESFMFNLIISIVNFKKQFEKYPKIGDIRRGLAEKKSEIFEKKYAQRLIRCRREISIYNGEYSR